jgi:hypothetical protein
MDTQRPVVRAVATVLVAAQATGCGSAWKRPVGVTPADAVTTWQPEVVRVPGGGRTIELRDPAVRGDSLTGLVFADRRADDSLGGPGGALRRWEPFAVPLGQVKWIEVRAIPLDRLAPGQPVRLWPSGPKGPPVRAVVSSVTGDSLVVSVNGEERRIGAASMERLDVQTGSKGHAGVGILIGIAFPVALGALILATGEGDAGSGAVPPNVAGAAVVLVVGVPVGGLLGAGVGAAYRTEQWRRVPLDRAFPGRAP